MNHLTPFLLFFSLLLLCSTWAVSEELETSPENDQTTTQNSIDLTHIDMSELDNLTEEEQDWYVKFQNGLLFFDGWKQISEDILTALPEESAEQTRIILETLGIKIGTEWSRDNGVRKIDTDQLKEWGRRLRKAKKESPEQLDGELKDICREVESILGQPILDPPAETGQ